MPTTPIRRTASLGVLCALACLPVTYAAPAADPGPAFSLIQAEEAALRQNPEILAARERVRAAEARSAAVEGLRWPTLSLSLGGLRTDNPAQAFAAKLNAGQFAAADFALPSLNRPDPVTLWSAGISVQAPIDAFGKIRAAADARRAGAESSAADVEEAESELRLEVEQAYRRAALAEATIATTTQAIAAAQARENDVATAAQHGAALEADVLRARARRRQREADLAGRHAERDAALARLRRLTGDDDGSGTTTLPWSGAPLLEAPPTATPLPGSLDVWLGRAAAQRGSLRAAQAALRAAAAGADAALRERRPDLGVFGNVANERTTFAHGSTSTTLGASLRWGAFDRSRAAHLAEADAARRAAQQAAAAARAEVRMEVTVAYRQAEAARERWQAAAGGAEEGAEALRVVRERRAAGVATLSDELATEAEALAAKLEEQSALSEVALADAALRRAAGQP